MPRSECWDQPRLWPLALDGHYQRRRGQLGAQVVAHGPPHNLAGVQVHDGGQVEPALACGYVGQICQPDLVRPAGRELPVQQIWGNREGMTAIGGAHPPRPGHEAAHAMDAHQPLDTAASHSPALYPERRMHARAAISALACGMHGADVVQQRPVLSRPLAIRPAAEAVAQLQFGTNQPKM